MKSIPQEKRFLTRRRQLVRAWAIIGPLVLLLLLAAGILLFLSFPLMFNPYEVINRIESGTLEYPTLQLMALLLPVMMLMLFAMLVVMVLLVYAVIVNDRKYLAIIDRYKGTNAGPDG